MRSDGIIRSCNDTERQGAALGSAEVKDATRSRTEISELGPEYDTIFRGLRFFFVSRGVRADDASDLAQETIVRAFVHIKRHGVTSDNLWPLLRTIAKNLYADRARRSVVAHVPLSSALGIPDDAPGPDEVVTRLDGRRQMWAALEGLPERYQHVIQLSLRGHGPAEIAAELGIKRNTADALLHRARRRLATQLEAAGAALGAVFGPFALRLRSAARKFATTAGQVDPSGGFACAAMGLATVAVVAALSGSPVADRIDDGTQQVRGGAANVVALPRDAASVRTALAPSGEAANGKTRSREPAGVVADLNAHHFGADPGVQSPTDPDDTLIAIETWHEREDGNRGTTGPVLDSATENVCSNVTVACQTGTK